jgi:Domain of unknown function (DUF4381)
MSADWLNQLAPEHAPPAPPWWPPAAGWWLLAALCVLAALAILAYRRLRQGRRSKVRRAAFAELKRIRAQGGERAGAEIQRLLRRYALAVFGADRVAPLTGNAWLEFLGHHGGEGLASEEGRALLEAAYGGGASSALREEWLVAAAAFIRRAPRRPRKPAR